MVPHLITALNGPINELEQRILDSTPAIERWFRTNRTSPMTGEVLASLTLIPNHTLRCMISSTTTLTQQ